MENGFGGFYNSKLFKIRIGHQGHNTSSKVTRAKNLHFIYRDKSKNTYYFYSGANFEDRAGYDLLMMAKFFPEQNEIRIYSQSDIVGKTGMISSKYRVK